MSLKGKTLFITGASRGIGLTIALKAARDGANIAIAAKTETPHPKLPGTIHTAAAEIEQVGGRALPMAVDIRDEAAVQAAIARTVATFGGLDIVVNNASAVAHAGGRDRHEAIRSDAWSERARYFHGVEIRDPASGEIGQSAHPDEFAAARH